MGYVINFALGIRSLRRIEVNNYSRYWAFEAELAVAVVVRPSGVLSRLEALTIHAPKSIPSAFIRGSLPFAEPYLTLPKLVALIPDSTDPDDSGGDDGWDGNSRDLLVRIEADLLLDLRRNKTYEIGRAHV